MEKVSFKCPVDEWYLARIYMELEHVEGKAKALKRKLLKELFLPSTLLFLWVLAVLIRYDISLTSRLDVFGFLLV
ncbi:hypothetical protein D7X33_47495, partial [Butyricicoccus sp. 1XD8-22]